MRPHLAHISCIMLSATIPSLCRRLTTHEGGRRRIGLGQAQGPFNRPISRGPFRAFRVLTGAGRDDWWARGDGMDGFSGRTGRGDGGFGHPPHLHVLHRRFVLDEVLTRLLPGYGWLDSLLL